MKEGMALYYWTEEQDPEKDFPTIVYEYKNYRIFFPEFQRLPPFFYGQRRSRRRTFFK